MFIHLCVFLDNLIASIYIITMFEEFLLLLESEKEKIKEVLKPHLHETIFKRLLGGFFDDSHKRFIAFAFMPIKKSMFYEYDYLFELTSCGNTAVYFSPNTVEENKIYITKDTFQYKSTKDSIEDGVYKSLLISYTGEFDFEEWNIKRNCCFSDSKDKKKLLNSAINNVNKSLKDHFLNNSTFQEVSEYHTQLLSFVRARDKDALIKIPVEDKPFVGHSYLVALVRSEKKSKLNLSFREYIIKAVYQPLIVSLKTQYPERYHTVSSFYGDDCNFLIPSHRQYCLMIFAATNQRKKTSLQFYLYNLQEHKLYKWIYFELYPHHEKPDYDLLVRIFSPISQFDDMGYATDPRCNFDDDNFWNNYVFKKDGGAFLYLTEIEQIKFI